MAFLLNIQFKQIVSLSHVLNVIFIIYIAFFVIPNVRSHVTFLNELDKYWLKVHRAWFIDVMQGNNKGI